MRLCVRVGIGIKSGVNYKFFFALLQLPNRPRITKTTLRTIELSIHHWFNICRFVLLYDITTLYMSILGVTRTLALVNCSICSLG